MLVALAWLAALVAYPVAAWVARFCLMVVTLPLAGPVREARSVSLLRAIRSLGGAACGAGGFAAAAWVAARLAGHASLPLVAAVVVLVALVHGPALRRLAGGPQFAEELFAFAGEEFGVLAAATWHVAS